MELQTQINSLTDKLKETKNKNSTQIDGKKITQYEEQLSKLREISKGITENSSTARAIREQIKKIQEKVNLLQEAYKKKNTMQDASAKKINQDLHAMFNTLSTTTHLSQQKEYNLLGADIQKSIQDNLVLTTLYTRLSKKLLSFKNTVQSNPAQSILQAGITTIATLQNEITEKARKNSTYLNKNAREEILYQYTRIIKNIITDLTNKKVDTTDISASLQEEILKFGTANKLWNEIHHIKGNTPPIPEDSDDIGKALLTRDKLNQRSSPVTQKPAPTATPKPSPTPTPKATPSATPKPSPTTTPSNEKKEIQPEFNTLLSFLKQELGLSLPKLSFDHSVNNEKIAKDLVIKFKNFIKPQSTDPLAAITNPDLTQELQKLNLPKIHIIFSTTPSTLAFQPEKVRNTLRIFPNNLSNTLSTYTGTTPVDSFRSSVKILASK